ncbi:MAG: ATP-binding protein [Pseudomonadota bacterium]
MNFNIAGPCQQDEHYMLPSQDRCKGIYNLIEQKQYFVIHAARQSGKTTLLLELAQELNEADDYYALYCSLETAQGISEPEKGIPAIIRALHTGIKFHHRLKKFAFAEQVNMADFNVALIEALTYFCMSLDKPLIVLFDEVDCLLNGTLISFLRQLRDGYINRSAGIPFVHSIALVGMRNIRDYKCQISPDQETLGSPFNIVSEIFTLKNFTKEEVTNLYIQHTKQTEQVFSSDVIDKIYHYTQGQPWLVNAIAREIVVKMFNNDFSQLIEPEHVERAVQSIILQRGTHLDSLMERLKEKRVQRIVEPVIIGESKGYSIMDDDYQYVLDLGLLRHTETNLIPSNPIYGEVIIRTLTYRSQMEMSERSGSDLKQRLAYIVDGKLDMKILLSDFQKFWQQNSEIWVKKYQYQEAAPHLVMQAFLQRVVNSGGRISRELAGGTGRIDLCIHYEGEDYPIELKLRYSNKTYEEGLRQITKYLDKFNCQEGWLIVFDRRKKTSWRKKMFWKTSKHEGNTIHIVGC